MISQVRKLFSGDGLKAQLLRGGVGSLAIKVGSAGLGFLVAVTLARVLGPEGYGVYSFALAIIMLTAIPAQVGVPQLVVRETAKAQANGNYGLMRGLWRWGNLAVAIFSALALVVVGCILWLTDVGGEGTRVATLTTGIALIPVIALANVRGACLRGLRKVVQGQLPESIIRPALLLFLALVWGTWFVEASLSPELAMGFYVVAAVLAFIIGVWMLRRSRPAELRKQPAPEYQSLAWRKAVIPLAMITGLQLINNYADLIILGIFRSDEEVGIYRAVFQVALLVVFGLQAVNQVIMPHFSRIYVRNELKQLQRLVTVAARMSMILAIPIAGVLILFSDLVMSWIFGGAYVGGANPLTILAFGQLVVIGIGYGWTLLSMTGHEMLTFKALIFGAIVNIALNLVLIPPFGMSGAAVSTVIGMIVAKLIGLRMALKVVGIESSIIGRQSFV